MNAFDFSPLLRSAIGFDRVANLMDNAQQTQANVAYPPYNIERTGEDSYRLTLAVAGFSEADLELSVQNDTLLISGKAKEPTENVHYLHRGIAGRAFERRFVLADHLVVEDAKLEHGLLHVGLRREVPETLKPRRIAIGAAPQGVAPATIAAA